MTIVLALKKDDEVWIAADSMVVAENLIIDTVKSSKIIKLPTCYIGFCGNVMFREYFELYCEQTKQLETFLPPNPNKLNVMKTFITFWSFMKEHEARMSSDESESYSALVVTPTTIFEVDPDNTVTELSKFGAIGSGGVMASGILECLWTRSSSEDILKETHKIVCKYNNMCGGDQEIHNVTKKFGTVQPTVKIHKKPVKNS